MALVCGMGFVAGVLARSRLAPLLQWFRFYWFRFYLQERREPRPRHCAHDATALSRPHPQDLPTSRKIV